MFFYVFYILQKLLFNTPQNLIHTLLYSLNRHTSEQNQLSYNIAKNKKQGFIPI